MMKAPVLTRLLAAALVVTPALGQAAAAQDVTTPLAERMPDVIYVPTPQPVVEAMLRMANVKPGDVLYDLGSGDGRIPITETRLHGDRKRTRLNSSHYCATRMPYSARKKKTTI